MKLNEFYEGRSILGEEVKVQEHRLEVELSYLVPPEQHPEASEEHAGDNVCRPFTTLLSICRRTIAEGYGLWS